MTPITSTSTRFHTKLFSDRRHGLALKTALKHLILSLCLLGLASPAFAAPANGEKVKARYGEWEVICATPLGSKSEKCGAVSKVKAADIPDVGLVITFMKTTRNDKTLLRIRAPLGILLPTGLGLKIDDKDVGRVNFVRCTVSGCIANVFIDDKLEAKFKKGNTAMFIIFKTPERGIAIPISLNGLTKAYGQMK